MIVLPIREKYQEYAKKIHTSLEDLDLRVDVNFRDDRIGYKVREASMQKIPFVLIVGEKELENSTVNVRSRDKGDLGEMNLERFIESLGSWKK